MRRSAPCLLVFLLAAGLSAAVHAETAGQLTPPAPKAPAIKPAAKAAPRKPVAVEGSPTTQPPAVPPLTGGSRGDADLAYGAFQRGFYMTAFAIATRRVNEKKDVKAMTLLGELYANGLGVERDDKKAVEWYRLGAERGDREALFALALLHLSGRIGGAVNRDEGAKLLAQAAKLGHTGASYNLGVLYIEGQAFPQDFARAAELFRIAAQAGNPEAQYALATLYKEGRGVPKDFAEAARLLAAATLADHTDAQVEYAIALFNGTGVTRNEELAVTLLKKAARKGNAIAQNRLANVLASGRGVPADPIEALKWHIVAKAGGVSDIPLDSFAEKQSVEVRTAAEKAAKPWLDALKEARESRS
ncbi:MAG: tetratricopeptide repeat protein [Xanthobacteraceae bacterium]